MSEEKLENVAPEANLGPKKGSGYWQVPNAYYKKIRKLSMNEVREECLRLAGALMDQRNANYVLMQKLENLKNEPAVGLETPKTSMEGQNNE